MPQSRGQTFCVRVVTTLAVLLTALHWGLNAASLRRREDVPRWQSNQWAAQNGSKASTPPSILHPFRDFGVQHFRLGGELLSGERVMLHVFLKGFKSSIPSSGAASLTIQGYGFAENLNETT